MRIRKYLKAIPRPNRPVVVILACGPLKLFSLATATVTKLVLSFEPAHVKVPTNVPATCNENARYTETSNDATKSAFSDPALKLACSTTSPLTRHDVPLAAPAP